MTERSMSPRTMWILVVGAHAARERDGGAVATLRDLGCRVLAVDLFDTLDEAELAARPPAAVVVEALDEWEAARAALARIRSVRPLVEVPVLAAISVSALQRVGPADGFDDIVLVPFVPAELYARIRRAEWRRSEFSDRDRVKIGAMCVDLGAHEVTVDGRMVELTHQEFALLRFLSQHRGRVFSRDQLLTRVWGVDYYGGSRTVDIHVRRLRMKLGPAGAAVLTVRGVGYKMKSP